MHRIIFWFGVIYALYISKEIYAIECPDDNDFTCSNEEKCIASHKVCDKIEDCTDGSDEEDCDCLPPDWYLCKDNITCLSHSQVCDGSNDCPIYDDDERNCTGSYVPHHEIPECNKDEFSCISDGICLALEAACDGVKQCMDGSDETIGCFEVSKRCSGFHCKNGHCLTDIDWVCDGHNDCGDNSDEPQNCIYNCKLSKGRFLCNDNSSCIPLNKLCNGKADCPKGDDESSSCRSAKEECISKECPEEAQCQYLPGGSVCICPEGYLFNATSAKCEDIDECLTYGICSQGCVNTEGGYQCICSPKFKLASDNRTCTLDSSKDAILMYAASSSVNVMTLNTHHIHRVADNLKQVVGICYNRGYIYWTDIAKQVESVMRSKIHGHPETIFISGLGKPEDITVDHVTGNIYFSDYDHQHIAVCSNDARYCKVLITMNVHRPRGVALHTLKGQMFWSDWGTKPMIGIASMDGKSAKPFISDNIHWPNGLALDRPNDRLYWVDAKLECIESCKLDGSDRRAVIKHVSKHPYGIAVFEDKLYWSDWHSKSIQSCNKFTGKNRTTIVQDKIIYDIHIYHSAMQGSRENPCQQAPCSHLCLLNSNNSYTCDCPKYWALSKDNHTCNTTEKRKTLLLGMGNRFVLMEHQSFGRHNDAEGKIVQINIDKMAYNSLKGNVVVADNKDKIIYEVELKTFATRKLVADNIENITAMAFDKFANTLYWTDAERGTLEVYSFNTQHRAIVHHYMGHQTPIGLAIVPEKGKLYVALRSKTHTYIDMMPSNGRGTHHHLLKDEMGDGPVNMLPDHNLEKIFITDHEHSAIKYMSFSGEMYHTLLNGVDMPASLAIIGDELFWSTSKSLVLNRTPTHSMTGTKSMVIQHPKTIPVPDVMVLQTITTVKMSKHPCITHNNNGCSHLCVAMSANIASCLCPNGMVFNDSKNKTCINSRECFFRCGSGECISEAEHCNSKIDCADHSDEINCARKKTINCSPDDFICADNSKCIDRSLRCDKKFDCNDESDEADCDEYNPKSKCHERQFMCYDGTCIKQEHLCDGFKDCAKEEDELKENCETYGTCASDEFKCDNGQCIMDSWICDGANDCNDGSDEKHCAFAIECPTDYQKCDDGECLPKNVWCDGNNDCNDLSDEQNCTSVKEVKEVTEIKEVTEVTEVKEVKEVQEVKEVKEVKEVTEVKEAKKLKFKCDDPNKFQCQSDKVICLDVLQLCNGIAECPNGEDEANCHYCTTDQFKCEKNECIPMEKHCDNHKDCKNGKDEMGCDQNATNSFYSEKVVSRSMGDILMIFVLVVLTIIVACAVIRLGIIVYQKYQANAAANLIVHFKNGTDEITTMSLDTSDDTIKLLP